MVADVVEYATLYVYKHVMEQNHSDWDEKLNKCLLPTRVGAFRRGLTEFTGSSGWTGKSITATGLRPSCIAGKETPLYVSCISDCQSPSKHI